MKYLIRSFIWTITNLKTPKDVVFRETRNHQCFLYFRNVIQITQKATVVPMVILVPAWLNDKDPIRGWLITCHLCSRWGEGGKGGGGR